MLNHICIQVIKKNASNLRTTNLACVCVIKLLVKLRACIFTQKTWDSVMHAERRKEKKDIRSAEERILKSDKSECHQEA